MGKKTDIHAVEIVRQIRDQQAELLKDKSNQEIIDFFRKAAEHSRRHAKNKHQRVAKKPTKVATSQARR